ncbi:carbon storage regulator [Cellulomonas denverensis]|uniref:carbon storage regulator n=1 Tax=Cellulomonas denverensis TaxID=264297 RepID=UPI0035E6C944
MIGDDIVVTVIEVRSDGVRLGIDAPRSVAVHRAEVLEAVTAANVAASSADDDDAESLRTLLAPRPADGSSADQQVPADRSAADQRDSTVAAPAEEPAPEARTASAEPSRGSRPVPRPRPRA